MQYLWIYFLIINSITLILWGIDKFKAKKNYWRISEKILLWGVLLGWFLWWLLGMHFFHHKTIKSSFLWKFWILFLIWLGVSVYFWIQYL